MLSAGKDKKDAKSKERDAFAPSANSNHNAPAVEFPEEIQSAKKTETEGWSAEGKGWFGVPLSGDYSSKIEVQAGKRREPEKKGKKGVGISSGRTTTNNKDARIGGCQAANAHSRERRAKSRRRIERDGSGGGQKESETKTDGDEKQEREKGAQTKARASARAKKEVELRKENRMNPRCLP